MKLTHILVGILALFTLMSCSSQSPENKAVVDYADSLGLVIKSGDVKNADPAILFCYSNHLWTKGEKDEAVFWYYVAQYRYRFLSSCSENLQAGSYTEAQAKEILLATNAYPKENIDGLHLVGGMYRIELYEVIQAQLGQIINGYGYGDLPQMTAMLDRLLAYQEANPFNAMGLDPQPVLKSKEIQAEKLVKIKESYISQKDEIATTADYIKSERLNNGLDNRN